jgi:hypothetical protein
VLAILGGSSPWTIPLLRALEADSVVLVGRDGGALEFLRRFAQDQIPAIVHVSTDAEEALAAATAVLCQARIGGAAGRAADETGPARWGAWGDEALGLGGLRSALRSRATLARWAQLAGAKPALVFTNPTDLLARWWTAHAGAPAISVCEVPTLLLRGLPPGSRYLGVNHLGFGVTPGGERRATKWVGFLDRLPELVEEQRTRPPDRAAVVAALDGRLREAVADGAGAEVDRLLALREPVWHEQLIAPLLHSLARGEPFRGVLGLPNGERLRGVDPGVVVESLGSASAPEPLGVESAAAAAVGRFALARQRAWECLLDLNEDTLRRYLATDPFSAGVGYSPAILDWLGEAAAEGEAIGAQGGRR